ncbi:MAG TPA: Npt1/Npt2 family nucleotide transporter, partial [Kofleriaceae bacterium]
YAMVASRVARMTLIDAVMGLFALSFVAFSALLEAGAPIGVPFYLWLGIFNMLVIAQFWSLANELFSPAQGKRLFAIIAFGGTIGAIAGAFIAEQLIGSLGISAIMLLAAGLLVACIALTSLGARIAHRMPRGEDNEDSEDKPATDKPLDKAGAFKLVATQRYLRMIALMIVLYNVVNTLGEYILGSVVTETAKAEAGGDVELAKQLVGEFYGSFFTWVNVVAAILQALVVSRIVKYLGVRIALVLVPAVAMGSYALLAAAPVLAWIRVAKIAENGLDYSLHNTVRQMLWLPTTPEVKYKAKAAIDTFFVRAGDVLAAGLVALGSWFALSSRGFAFVNLAIVGGWIALVVIVGRLHARALADRPRPPERRKVPAKPAEPAIRLPRTHGTASV